MNITISKFWLLSCLVFLLFFLSNEIKAQDKRSLIFLASEQDKEIINNYFDRTILTDSVGAINLYTEIVHNLHSKGFLTAGVDSIFFSEDDIKVFIQVGDQFQWANLDPGNVGESLLSLAGYKKSYFNQKKFHYSEVLKLFDKILNHSENQGYPFATIGLDSIIINENQVTATLKYDEGAYIIYDSLVILGNSKTKKKFLSDYLRISQGQPYEELNFKNIPAKLKRLPYLRLVEPPQVTFQNNEGTIHLNIEDKKINQIDGIIGFFPNAGNDNKLLLTGQFNLLLQNMFGTGKALHLEWQKIKPLSQLLDISYFHPNIISSPINLGASFSLLKEDTTFINRDAGINFSINKGLYSDIRIYTNIRSSNLLSTSQFKNSSILPEYADFVLNSYGIGYKWSNLDDLFFPTRGILFEMDGAVGNKNIKKNGKLPQELYDDISERSLQIHMKTEISAYYAVKNRIVILNRLRGGVIKNDQLFLNDLFRIGGLHSLRGFNENFFFASQFLTTTCEVRMMLDNESYFQLFADQGVLKYNLTKKNFIDYPTGIGLGLNLALDGGIFNFVYALGGAKAQPLNFQSSKIHFGYISRF